MHKDKYLRALEKKNIVFPVNLEGPKALGDSPDALVPWAVSPAKATNPVAKRRQGDNREEETTVECRVTQDKLSHQPFSSKIRGQNGLGVSISHTGKATHVSLTGSCSDRAPMASIPVISTCEIVSLPPTGG